MTTTTFEVTARVCFGNAIFTGVDGDLYSMELPGGSATENVIHFTNLNKQPVGCSGSAYPNFHTMTSGSDRTTDCNCLLLVLLLVIACFVLKRTFN
jgi:hypothetical protein